MIFVVEHVQDGKVIFDVIHGEHLDADQYASVNKIFFCDTDAEAQGVLEEIRNWGDV